METIELIEPADVIDRAEFKAGKGIVEYTKTATALADLRQRFAGVTYDLTTTKGDKDARAARLELTKLRSSLEGKRKEFKSPALEFGKLIDSEAKRIESEILALEKPIDDQIKADEQRRADEKAERERLAQVRTDGFRARIGQIRAFAGKCAGISAARIETGIGMVSAIDTSAGAFEEFSDDAEQAKQETLAAMRQSHADTLAREQEAERLEAQRVGNERIAAEQRAQAAELERQRAEIEARERKVKEAEAEAERIRAEEQAKAQREADAKLAQEIAAANAARAAEAKADADRELQRLDREFSMRDAAEAARREALNKTLIVEAPHQAVVVPIRPAAPAILPSLSLGEIGSRLGFSLTAAFVQQLGFEPTVVKAARLFRESDFPLICAALVTHIQRVQTDKAA